MTAREAADTAFPDGFVWSDDEARPVYELYTARETADNLGVSERTVRRWIEAGKLSAEKVGGEFRVRQEDAIAALRGSRAGRTPSMEQYVEWLERENERLWALLEKAVSS